MQIAPGFKKGIQGDWFNEIKEKRKTVEGRVGIHKWGNLKKGDVGQWFRYEDESEFVNVVIISVKSYSDLGTYLEEQGGFACPHIIKRKTHRII
jgi:ASC-1-like (ASCH) protein